jgi:hypothetical protein
LQLGFFFAEGYTAIDRTRPHIPIDRWGWNHFSFVVFMLSSIHAVPKPY